MTPAYGRTATDEYYVCAGRRVGTGCPNPYARVTDVDEQVAAAVVARLEELRSELTGPPTATSPPKPKTAEQRRAKLEGRRQRAIDLALDGALSKDDLAATLARIDADLAKLQADPEPEPPMSSKERRTALGHVRAIRKAWTRMTPAERREVVSELAERIPVKDGKARPVWAEVRPIDVDG